MALLLSLLDHYGVLQRRQKDGILSEFSKGGVDVLPYPFFTAQPNSQSKLSLVLTYHHSQLLECVDFLGDFWWWKLPYEDHSFLFCPLQCHQIMEKWDKLSVKNNIFVSG